MAGMRALGRVYNPVADASGVAISLKECSGIGLLFYCGTTAASTLTFTAAKTFGGSYVAVTPGNGFGQPGTWYQQAAVGTDAWTAETSSWSSNALTVGSTSGYASYVDFLVSELADGYCYLKVAMTAGTGNFLVAIPYDLTVQREPANLAIISA
jgi:hypothetical protein